jgi:hypothetical protein
MDPDISAAMMAVDTSTLMAIVRQSLIHPTRCHCEPTGPRSARPEDRLREAISCPPRSDDRDCFVASLLAMTGGTVFFSKTTSG